jgi:4-alpha-glucanotransferase
MPAPAGHLTMRLPRASGILLHPTSLPGPHGSGDFGIESYRFVDWLRGAGQHLWQMLPLGGLGPGNSPYMSNSAFAGNVLLIDLHELQARGWLADEDLLPVAALSAQRVDYAAAHAYRIERLRRAARRFFDAPGDAFIDYENFCAAEHSWLDDFALFMSLAESNGWRDWTTWDAPLARRTPRALARAEVAHEAEIDFWKFTQWCFLRQWRQLKRYANERGIQIVGDIPIFISHQSAEVWARQDLFDLDGGGHPTVVAGVPPDFFSSTGQRWGNPLYRWASHAREGYAWWIERMRRTTALYDIVRIDHFRGFAGYWEIPSSEPTAIHGRWVDGPGARLFDAIQQALGRLPIIAEDLGVLTPDVIALREKFDLPGMRILHFAFGSDSANPYLPHNYDPNTVVYTGTHDNDTTVGWFAAASARERAFACKYVGCGATDFHWHLMHAASASIADTALYPMQDVLGLDTRHRMNLPGQSSGYWEWRFTWDQVKPEYAERLYEMTAAHGRCAADRLDLSVDPLAAG